MLKKAKHGGFYPPNSKVEIKRNFPPIFGLMFPPTLGLLPLHLRTQVS